MSCGNGKTLLAEGPFCRVEGCACGTMHVSIGPLTVRLAHDVVESLWETLRVALERAASARVSSCRVAREHLS